MMIVVVIIIIVVILCKMSSIFSSLLNAVLTNLGTKFPEFYALQPIHKAQQPILSRYSVSPAPWMLSDLYILLPRISFSLLSSPVIIWTLCIERWKCNKNTQ
jgi:hypothetical protein